MATWKVPDRQGRSTPKGILAQLARASHGGLITPRRAADALGISARSASVLLASLMRRGWLERARRGLYLILPLEAGERGPHAVEDPWVLAIELYAPCYIGGWSAAEHWGLTEQIFRSTFVATAAGIRTTRQVVLGAEFRLAYVPRRRVEAATPEWRGAIRVPVSNRETTIADALANPAWVGGIRHLADILAAYRASTSWDPAKLTKCLQGRGSGAAYKRLGLITEVLYPNEARLIASCREHRTSGNVKLDPAVRTRGRLSKRWGLWVNVTLAGPGNPK
jgi:predicted transcriptional regulator of viral defense system